MDGRSSGWIWPLVALLQLLVVVIAVERGTAPPPAQPGSAAADTYSAQRAMRHVEAVTVEPHPTGSAANARVRDHLRAKLAELGLTVEVQRSVFPYRHERRGGGNARFATVENVIAVRPGREAGPALLLMSHYDSVPGAPGAGDAASGVATVLETLRALGDAPLRNRVVVLFTDGEEIGLIGAQAFFAQHPLAADIGLVLNFEGRGSGGPVAMFETSDGNAALIAAMADSVAQPLTDSLAYSLYRQMPNDTDLSIAKAAGLPGMNFAFADGLFDYHSPTDTAKTLSPDTLQHLGDHALPLVRRFGDAALPLPAADEVRYFTVLGHLVHYPGGVDVALLVVIALLLAVGLVRLRRATGVGAPGLLRAIFASLALLALPLLIVALLGAAAQGQDAQLARLTQGRMVLLAWSALATGIALLLLSRHHHAMSLRLSALLGLALVAGAWFAGGLPAAAAALGVSALAGLAFARPLAPTTLQAGALLLFWLLALLLLLGLPGGAWLLLWSLLAPALAFALAARHPLAWLWATLPAMLLSAGVTLGFDTMVGAAMPAVAILPLLIALLLALPLLLRRAATPAGFALVLVGAALLLGFALRTPWSARHPQPTEAFLLHDHDRAETLWISTDAERGDWHRAVLGATPQPFSMERLLPGWTATAVSAAAAPVAAPTPNLALLSDRIVDDGLRELKLQLTVDGPSDAVNLVLPRETDLRGWAIDGAALQRPSTAPATGWRLRGFALPPAGVELTLQLGDPATALPQALLTSIHYALPASHPLSPRPATQMRRPYGYSDSVVTLRRIELAALVAEASASPISNPTSTPPPPPTPELSTAPAR